MPSSSSSVLYDFLSAPSVRVAPLASGLSMVSVEDARLDVQARQALLPLVSSADLSYDLAASLRHLAAMDSWEGIDLSSLLASMAIVSEAVTSLLKGPTVEGLVHSLKARLRCRRAATS